ncbi:type II secretion system inner membrane protein GspF [Natronospira bacteriovora]|uniref:General secretion pathway protein F n=1 Tax=Natronospira bacteriovora TaxID=3069753 RepID=A0ABU0WB85_9GAMM|nr:type II secretion system inner membrane protein GspF [Natronospira sp. AB-CW4]MDQ2070720.1 type II secretion system inner membrane protein GspF [Natronospira sp. AB-CW4]
MAAFEYTALDARGKPKKGVIEGDTARHIRQQLREQRLTPLEVREIAGGRRKAGNSESTSSTANRFGRGISAGDLALLTRQLATLIRSGLPLEEAVSAVAQQSEKARVKSILMAVRSRVLEGHTLADGLGEFPNAFPEIYRSTVAAGEQSGHLDGVLERLAEYTETRQQMRSKISQAMVYPIVLTVVAILIIVGMLVHVVPQVVTVFEDTGQQLPQLTQFMIGASEFLQQSGLWMLIGLVAVGYGVKRLLRQEGPRRRFHHLILRIPLVGRLNRGFNTARFARTLSILAGSGVPVLDSLRISGEVVSNLPMRDAIHEATNRVREGAPIGRSLAASGLFPPMTIHLIRSGETSGELEEMLERAASNQEWEMESLTSTLMSLLQPVLIMVMAVVVLLIVLALMMPILELNRLVA